MNFPCVLFLCAAVAFVSGCRTTPPSDGANPYFPVFVDPVTEQPAVPAMEKPE